MLAANFFSLYSAVIVYTTRTHRCFPLALTLALIYVITADDETRDC
jgi:hypothetical protein